MSSFVHGIRYSGLLMSMVIGMMGSLFASSDVQGGREFGREKPIQIFHHPSPSLLDGFGMSIAGFKQDVLVGTPHEKIRGRESGVAYLFDGQTQQVKHTFVPPRPIDGVLFGQTVAMTDRVVVIGAPRELDRKGTQTGAVYLFERKTGELLLTLYSPYPTNGSFGHAIAIAKNRILVGDPLASTPSTLNAGAAYVYDGTTGELLQVLRPPDQKVGHPDRFGHAVAFSGSEVLVGAPLGGTAPVDSGIVFLFDALTGQMRSSFTVSNLRSGDAFGWSLSTVDDSLFVGAFGHQGAYREEGVAYLFEMKNGKLIRTFKNPVPREGAHFGKTVATFPKLIAVAAPTESIDETMSLHGGVVYLFDRMTGELQHTLKDPEPPTGASGLFGLSLAAMVDGLLVGAPFNGKTRELDAGLVYWYDIQLHASSKLPENSISEIP